MPQPMAEPTPAAGPDAVERAQTGDADAFEEIYRANVGRVYALCLRMTGDRRRAEELTQDAFVRAWEKLDTFRGESSITTWLHRLTANVVRESWRSADRRQTRKEAAVEKLGLYEHESGGTAEDRLDLERAVAGLPEKARMVFLLYDVEGYKHREVAEMMGTAVGTAKAQLHRARKLLREDMER